jgi:hypothetical protein
LHAQIVGPRYTQRAWLALTVCGLVGLHAARVHAFPTGQTGYSGKAGFSCTPTCHIGGVAPVVSFQGPDQVAAGAVATFHFVVESQAPAMQVAAGLDIATSAGTLGTVSGQGEQLLGGDITHTSPQNNSNGGASWEFTWQAPAQPGTATLFGAGNSVNLDFTSFGDAAATTTFQVVVSDGSPPTPTETPTDIPTETPTPTPTSTPPGGCVGDCGGDGEVTIDEIMIGIDIALGEMDVGVCEDLDVNKDGQVTVNELTQAVSVALHGCVATGL